MCPLSSLDRDRLYQQLGERNERIRQLEQLIIEQREQWESGARDWQRLERHKRDLASWLVDAASDEHGNLIEHQIDAALGGEAFVPCTFTTNVHGKRYRLSLVATHYHVEEI